MFSSLRLVCVWAVCGLVLAFPEQVHIAFAGPSAMNIAWYTTVKTNSTVNYGYSRSAINFTESNNQAKQYVKHYGFHHSVTISSLQPNTTVYYQVGDSGDGFSGFFSFHSPSLDTSEGFAVSIFGDMGYLGSTERPLAIPAVDDLMANWTAVPTRELLEHFRVSGMIDFVWHVGDIGYADDAFDTNPLSFQYEDAYSGFMNWMQNISATMPYMVSVGNHESECHSAVCVLNYEYGWSLNNFSAYNNRWHMPSASSHGVLNMWYSYDLGPVHFVSINTETDFPGAEEEFKGDSGIFPAGQFAPDGEYMRWLENDLKQAWEAREQKSTGYHNWIIVAGHRPYHSIKDTGVIQLFNKYGVDMYVCGHTHSYLRAHPTSINGGVDTKSIISNNHYHDAQAPMYIVSGGAGCDEMKYIGYSSMLTLRGEPEEVCEEPVPFGSEVVDYSTDLLSAGILKVINKTAVEWTLYSSDTFAVLDRVLLTKSS